MSNAIFKLSSAGGVTSETRYPNMLTNYGDFGALTRIGFVRLTSNGNTAFYNIPQTFQDLIIVANVRGTNASTVDNFVISPVYATQYSNTFLNGNGSSATSTRDSSQYGALPLIPGGNATAGVFGTTITHVLNYANTTTFKTMLTRSASDANGSGSTQLIATLRSSTSAITFFEFGGANAVLASGSTIALYGVKASAA